MSQIKKAYSILAKSEEFSMQLRHVNTLLDRKAYFMIKEYFMKASLFIHLYLRENSQEGLLTSTITIKCL